MATGAMNLPWDSEWAPPEEQASWRLAARGRRSILFLSPQEVWAFEAESRLCFVHSSYGRFDVDLSLTQLQSSPLAGSLLRPHRNWLVNVARILRLEQVKGSAWLAVGEAPGDGVGGLRVPVSREQTVRVRRLLLAGSVGVRLRGGLR